MAEVVGVAASAVTLAALFSSCVECFSYFKAAQNCPSEAESLLVQLDCEKARLLVWGNTVGILQTDSERRYAQLADVRQDELVRRCINQIIILLTDARELQSQYGGRTTNEQESQRYLAVLSVNSMNVFQSARRTFFARVGTKHVSPSLLSRIKWAVRDAAKFRILLLNLREFVNHLIQLVPVPPETISSIVEEDIVSTVDIGSLRLIENACDEGNYPQWSARATEVISEMGTVDRRNLMEILRDTDATQEVKKTFPQTETASKGKYTNLNLRDTFVVLTDKCLELEAGVNSNCTDSIIGSEIIGRYDPSSFDSSSLGRWNLGRRICTNLNLPDGFAEQLQQHREISLERMKIEREITDDQPRCRLYVYCGICACAINTACNLATGEGIPGYLDIVVRVDDRVPTSCRESDSALSGLHAIRNAIDDCEADDDTLSRRVETIDCPALEKRIYALEQETNEREEPQTVLQKLMHEETIRYQKSDLQFAGIVFIAETEICAESLEQVPFICQPRRPRASEIYKFYPSEIPEKQLSYYTRKFLGRFSKSLLWRETEKARKIAAESLAGQTSSVSQPDVAASSRKRPRSDSTTS